MREKHYPSQQNEKERHQYQGKTEENNKREEQYSVAKNKGKENGMKRIKQHC